MQAFVAQTPSGLYACEELKSPKVLGKMDFPRHIFLRCKSEGVQEAMVAVLKLQLWIQCYTPVLQTKKHRPSACAHLPV